MVWHENEDGKSQRSVSAMRIQEAVRCYYLLDCDVFVRWTLYAVNEYSSSHLYQRDGRCEGRMRSVSCCTRNQPRFDVSDDLARFRNAFQCRGSYYAFV